MQTIRLTLLLAVSTFTAAQSPAPARSPWLMQDSGTTAGLRGIDSVDGTVAWASGTGGTVLKTIDGGAHWTACAVPDAATDGATLDFRGVQAWDANTAIAMASGPGEKSRLYKTIDGCKTWTLLEKNTEKDGFWDDFVFQRSDYGYLSLPDDGELIGDPLHGRFDTHVGYKRNIQFLDTAGCEARDGEAAFAASNSSFVVLGFGRYILGTGGKSGARVLIAPKLNRGVSTVPCLGIDVPIIGGNESSGVFSLAIRDVKHLIAVGGDYTKPYESKGTAAHTDGDWHHWTASTIPPHGFRSAVKWSEALKLWITAGTNGSDLSRDDGKTWQPLDDGNWNALSLPFVVGPNGRIAKLDPAALPPAQ
jgi:photosystem II stability/assembly factor-like uncharacterized protein